MAMNFNFFFLSPKCIGQAKDGVPDHSEDAIDCLVGHCRGHEVCNGRLIWWLLCNAHQYGVAFYF